jgi:ATP-dependent helicase HrpB
LLKFAGGERNVDLRLRLDVLRSGSSGSANAHVDAGARHRVKRSVEQLARQLGTIAADDNGDIELGRVLALAYPDRIAQSRGAGGRFLLSNGRGAKLPEAQSLSASEFLVVADLDAAERDATIRLAAPITRAAVETDFAPFIETRERIEWDSRERAVLAKREQWLGALKLAERRIEDANPESISTALLAGVREMSLECLPWTKESRQLRERLQFAHRVDTRQPNPWPDMTDAALLASLETWLTPWISGITRREQLARLDMHAILSGLLDWNLQQRLNTFAPTHCTVPSGSRIPIDYGGDAPSVAVRLQEVFGLQTTPTIAEGRVPLTLELLSPAHRPVQITQDLTSFWARGYPDVKKDLKGRYPKHYWPDDPLTAPATARAKPRK